MATGNIITSNVSLPVQAVVPVGKAGDGWNYFRAPSHWLTVNAALLGGAQVQVIAAVANRTIRLYRYILSLQATMVGPPPPPIDVATQWGAGVGGSLVMEHFMFATFSTGVAGGYAVFEAGPVGISPGGNVPFYLRNLGATDVVGRIFVQWSTEGWGIAPPGGGDGSDIS